MSLNRLVGAVVFVVAAGAAAAPPPRPTPTPVPPPNLLAPVLAEALGRPEPAVSATQEWLIIQAARVIEDWNTMLQQAEKLRLQRPESGDAFAALGAALEGLGKRGDAVAALERAGELRPSCKGAWLMLGMLRAANGENDLAGAAYEHGLAVDPGDRHLLAAAARAYVIAGNHAKAAPAYERLAATDTGDVEAWVWYAREASAAGTSAPMWAAFAQLRWTRPEVAARVVAALPPELRGAAPTPVPPTPRPTARPGAPRLVMGGAAAGGTGEASTVWSSAALAFEAKVIQIARKARPLSEMMERYDIACRGGRPIRPGSAGPVGEEGQSPAGAPGGGAAGQRAAVDWASVWGRRAAWASASATDGTAECRTLASDMLALANATESAVETAVKESTASGMSDGEKRRVLEKYNLRW